MEPEFIEFAESRGFDPEWLAERGFTLADEDETPFGGRWIKFPYPHRGGIWTHRYRRPLDGDENWPKYWAPKGTGHHLYNPLLLGPHSPEVWLVEGEFNALSLVTFDVPAIGVAGVNGFKRSWAYLFSEADVYIAFDNDEAGQKGAATLKGILPHAYILEVPPPHDINEWMTEDPEFLEEWITHA